MFKYKKKQPEGNISLNKLNQLTIKNKRSRVLALKKRL